MVLCAYILYIWLNTYKNPKIKGNKYHIFKFYTLQNMKGCLGHDLVTPFTQISLFITGNQIHSMHILYNEHLI